MDMVATLEAKPYTVYKITVYTGSYGHAERVTGKFEVAAENRRHAEDAGIAWALRNGIKPYRVSTMVKLDGLRHPVMILVAK